MFLVSPLFLIKVVNQVIIAFNPLQDLLDLSIQEERDGGLRNRVLPTLRVARRTRRKKLGFLLVSTAKILDKLAISLYH